MSFNIQTYTNVVISNNRKSEKSNFGKETVPKINCSGSVSLNGTTVTGNVNAGGSITAKNAQASTLNAGGSITATNVQTATLNAGGSVTIVDSDISNNVNADGSITANRCDQLG